MKSIARQFQSYVGALIDLVLPARARTKRLQQVQHENIPCSPASKNLGGVQVTTLLDYREQVVEDLIRALKYDGSPYAARMCASVLEDFLREEISSMRVFSAGPIVLMPVPLHKSRERERGFNQIGLVLKKLPSEFKDGTLSSINTDGIRRIRATKQQTHLSREARRLNVKDAFEYVESSGMEKAHVFLIDDVVTTGATLVSAGKVLEDAGASITLLALARA